MKVKNTTNNLYIVLKECKALEKTQALSKRTINKGIKSITKANINKKTKQFLEELTYFLIKRTK